MRDVECFKQCADEENELDIPRGGCVVVEVAERVVNVHGT